jgi:membrane protease YdiL (CAAX protease family)
VAYRYRMHLADPRALAPVPPAPTDGRTLTEEVLVVLSLSLLASAVYAVLDLLSAPLKGTYVAAGNQSNEFLKQVLGFVFGIAPVYLVLHLVRRDGEGVRAVGLELDRPKQDLGRGLILFLIIAAGGIAIYLGAVALGVNRFVVPVPPLGHWWTVPALLLNAATAALLEETIVLGYLVTRLEQLRWSPTAAVAGAALLRGSYHLYQGWGGFAGNLLMGLFFGFLFIRWRRTWPFVVAHFLLDVGAGVGFLVFRHHLPGFS